MSTFRRSLLAAVSLLALHGFPARADYTCQPLDVPGSTWTQLWELNNRGDVAAGSDIGGRIYSGGAWLALPSPPPGSPFAAADVNALGINDSGVIAGAASLPDGTAEQAFILRGGSYTFFSYLPAVHPNTEARAISPAGIVTGWSYDPATLQGVAWVYNPDGVAGYGTGFTEVIPVHPDGTPALFSIPGQMNAAGQFVGSANFPGRGRWGFLFDPAVTPPITVFRVGGTFTAPRGLNNRGQMVGFTQDAAGAFTGFLQTSQGFQLITCPSLPGATGVIPESINDSGVVSGIWNDAAGSAHGFVAYPDVVLPITSVNGAFVFDVAVSPNTPVFLDPEPAVGYRYAVAQGNPRFASVTLPIGVGDNLYTVLAGGRAFTLPAGQRLDFTQSGFAGGVAGFTVVGIEPAAGLDPASFTAFVTEVTFASGGRFTGTMTPMTIAGELDDLVRAALAGDEDDLLRLARRAKRAHAAGKTAKTCRLLAAFVEEVSERKRHRGRRDSTGALPAEAQAIRDALACPPAPDGRDDDDRGED